MFKLALFGVGYAAAVVVFGPVWASVIAGNLLVGSLIAADADRRFKL